MFITKCWKRVGICTIMLVWSEWSGFTAGELHRMVRSYLVKLHLPNSIFDPYQWKILLYGRVKACLMLRKSWNCKRINLTINFQYTCTFLSGGLYKIVIFYDEFFFPWATHCTMIIPIIIPKLLIRRW